MPVDRSKYSDDWEQISYAIRLRAKDRCEECRVPNGALIHRLKSDLERYVYHTEYKRLPEWESGLYSSKAIRVVLTCAHLDNDTTNNEPSNLKALCQLHHLWLDAPYHAQNARKTRQAKNAAKIADSGQLGLFELETPPAAVFSRLTGNSESEAT